MVGAECHGSAVELAFELAVDILLKELETAKIYQESVLKWKNETNLTWFDDVINHIKAKHLANCFNSGFTAR